MPSTVLFGNPPKMLRDVQRHAPTLKPLALDHITIDAAVTRVLQLPSVADKSFLITIADRSVGGLVCRDQMVGPWQVPVADVAVTASGFQSDTGEAMALGERTPIALINAPASGRMAIGEAVTNSAAALISRLEDVCLSANWMAAAGYAHEDAALFDTVRSVAMELCPALGLAIPVGKDSLSMQTVWQHNDELKRVVAPLSLIVSAFAPVSDVRRTLTPQLHLDQGDTRLLLIDLGCGRNRLGGSALAQAYQQLGHEAPDVDDPGLLKAFFATIQTLNRDCKLLAYHDRSDGGLLTTLCEMAFAGHCGLTIQLDELGADALGVLFNEELGAVIQIRAAEQDAVLQQLHAAGLANCCHIIGQPNRAHRC